MPVIISTQRISMGGGVAVEEGPHVVNDLEWFQTTLYT